MDKKKRAIVAITGASGVIIGALVIRHLLNDNADVFCIVSNAAKKIIPTEMDFADIKSLLKNLTQNDPKVNDIKFFDEDDFSAPPASGSFHFDAMALAPCSMKTLGKIANSIADNLIIRAAEVAIKERRRLVVCPRETPLALSHIRNMETLFLSGAVILPPSIPFYAKPQTTLDAANLISARIVASMGFQQSDFKEWGL